jgi:hypothetical protein
MRVGLFRKKELVLEEIQAGIKTTQNKIELFGKSLEHLEG